MAGVKLPADGHVLAFAAAADTDLVATVAGDAAGHPVSAKVTPLSEYPGKGRATAGVRCQRLLKGESRLILATVGAAPLGCDATGAAIALPEPDLRRDASGTPVARLLAHVGAARVVGT